jgi:hypothetical protein
MTNFDTWFAKYSKHWSAQYRADVAEHCYDAYAAGVSAGKAHAYEVTSECAFCEDRAELDKLIQRQQD